MEYYEYKIYTSTEGLEQVAAVLLSKGIEAYVTEDKNDVLELLDKKNAYDWDYVDDSVAQLVNEETAVIVYLEKSSDNLAAIEAVELEIAKLRDSDESHNFGRLETDFKVRSDEEWKDNWKEYFKPAQVTDRLVVKPSWEEYEASEGQLIIDIDPGMAFGTGTHETTTLCMKLMEKNLLDADGNANGKSVLDVGSGSGILSIAASLLGAGRVLGIEIDPVAVDVGLENAANNGLSDKVEIRQGDLTKGLNETFDLVVANLMADLVIALSPDVLPHMKDEGIFISSGILVEKKEPVKAAIESAGMRVTEIMEDGEWCAIAAVKA